MARDTGRCDIPQHPATRGLWAGGKADRQLWAGVESSSSQSEGGAGCQGSEAPFLHKSLFMHLATSVIYKGISYYSVLSLHQTFYQSGNGVIG